MSKAIRLSTTLLSVIGGCFYEIDRNKMFARLDMREKVNEGYKVLLDVLRKWPKAQDDQKTIRWVNDKIDRWEPHIKSVRNYHRLVVLAKVCERCYADLVEKNKSAEKVRLLAQLEQYIVSINDFADPDGGNFQAYSKCEELINYLYELIEWE
jgi:hypothetical protein